jgi:hypothetical protein
MQAGSKSVARRRCQKPLLVQFVGDIEFAQAALELVVHDGVPHPSCFLSYMLTNNDGVG